MADQASVFADQAPTPTDVKTPPEADQDDSLVTVLVGEGRKYRDHDSLAKGYMEAEDFIQTLKAENAELREKANAAKTVDDVLDRLNKQTAATDKGDAKQGLSASDVAKIVENTISGRETTKTRQENLLRADAELKRMYGDKAAEVFNREASTPALRAVLQGLAEVDPAKFVQLFNRQQPSTSQVTPGGGNTTNFASTSGRVSDPGTHEFYTEMRRKEPNKYYSAPVQLEMNKAALADPNKYFGRS